MIVTSLSISSSAINTALGTKYVQDVKMVGLPMLACSFLMVPSMMMALNVIYPQSFYEGTRIFGSFVFPDIPSY